MRKKLLLIGLVLVLAIGSGLAWRAVAQERQRSALRGSPATQQVNRAAYTLRLSGQPKFAVGKPTEVQFTIRDKNNRAYKAFDKTDDEVLRLYIIRKDRTNFQQVHAGYNPQTGVFNSTVNFPADGPYRMIAQFTPANAKADPDGSKTSVAPYVDITAGNMKAYVPIPPLAAKIFTSADGYDTNVFFSAEGDTPLSQPITYYTAETVNTVAIEINQGDAPVKNLQEYRGSSARLAAFGPDLEFSSANAVPTGSSGQTGLILFNLPFSKPGLYRLFMQTAVNGKFSTFDYNVTVKAAPTPAGGGQ